MLIQNLPKQSSSMDKDKRLPYSAPFLRIQEFTPSEYTAVCDSDVKEVEYGEYYPTIYWDYDDNEQFDETKDKFFSNGAPPSPLKASVSQNIQQSYLNNAGEFQNMYNFSGLNYFYTKSSFNKSNCLKVIYGIKSTDGYDFFFKSKPTLKKSHS